MPPLDEEADPEATGRPPILVAGMHRSGTSMVAGALVRLVGADVDPRIQPSNPHGQFERLDLRPLLDAALLLRRSTWRFPPPEAHHWPPGPVSDRLGRTAAHRVGPGPSVWKDPRLALTLPIWWRAMPTARVVVVLRHPADAAASLERRDGLPATVGLELWERYTDAVLRASAGAEVFIARYERWVADPRGNVTELAAWLGADDPSALAAATSSVAAPAAAATPTGHATPLWDAMEGRSGPTVVDGRAVPTSEVTRRRRPAPLGDLASTGLRTAVRLARR